MAAGTRHRILMVYFLLFQLLQSTTTQSQECLYQYMHQPTPEIDCNPYGRELQLHCGFIGPLSPEFNLKWYSSSAGDTSEPPLQLENVDDYTVNNIVLGVKSGHYVRSVSSVLLTGPIREYHRGKCLWCQAEFNGIAHPLKSNALCIQDESRYLDLDKCSNAVIVNTSLVCANVTEEFMAQVRIEKNEASSYIKRSTTSEGALVSLVLASAVTDSKPSVIEPSPSITHTIIHAGTVSGYKQLPFSLTSLYMLSMVTKTYTLPAISITPTPTIMNVESTAAGKLVTPTHTPEMETEAEGSKTSEGGLNFTESGVKSRTELEGPLYAAIAFCVMFVVIIVFLVAAIVCLSRKKCECLVLWTRSIQFWKKHKATTTDIQGHALVENTTVGGSDMHTILESGLHVNHSIRYEEETDRPGTKFPIRANTENPQSSVPWSSVSAQPQHGCSGETQQQSGNRNTTPLDGQSPHGHVPTPKEADQEALGSKKAKDKLDYDHLKPTTVDEDDNVMDQHEYAELEQPVTKRSKTPPKKPPRLSQSREHFYHTLENLDESGLLHSANTSRGGSQLSGMDDYAEANNLPPRVSISNQLQEIFDDPRYAAVFVEQDQLEDVHTHHTEVSRSRSTPSLVAVGIIPFSPTDTGRRSLRAVHHKRLSILSSHMVPNYC